MSTITRAVDFLEQIVEPDHKDAFQNCESLRHAYHYCIGLFSLRDWVYREFAHQPGWQFGLGIGCFQKYLEGQCVEFAIISDVANVTKHRNLTKPVGGKTGGIGGSDHIALYGAG